MRFDALQAIDTVDCSTPGCRANGQCTGELRQGPLIGWSAVYRCPDCGDGGAKSTPAVRALGEALVEIEDQRAREALVRRFVTSRVGQSRPLSLAYEEETGDASEPR